jgi:hypothetical protein
MSHFIAVKSATGEHDYVHYEVPEDVYIYIRQLEMFVKYPNISQIKKLYPERFDWREDGC